MKKALTSLVFFIALDILTGWIIFASLPSTAALTTSEKFQRKSSVGPVTIDPQSRSYVKLKDIPKSLQRAVIHLEDAQFYQHRGFDFVQIQDAIQDAWLRNKRLRGASTLSQQLVKNLYLSSDRTWTRKLLEALITIKLELTVPKHRILELYFNSIDWGNGVIGIRAAARHYFGKHPSQLSIRESVFLAAIVPNPARFGKFPEKQFVRRQMIRALQLLYRQKIISIEDFREALFESVEF